MVSSQNECLSQVDSKIKGIRLRTVRKRVILSLARGLRLLVSRQIQSLHESSPWQKSSAE